MAATDRPAIIVVCDAGPLIHLDELGVLDLLADFPQILVPEAVWQEATVKGTGASHPPFDPFGIHPPSQTQPP